MEPSPPPIPEAAQRNFEQLTSAIVNDRACLLAATRKGSGEPVFLVCAINSSEDERELVPFAELVIGDPYTLYEPPPEVENDHR